MYLLRLEQLVVEYVHDAVPDYLQSPGAVHQDTAVSVHDIS